MAEPSKNGITTIDEWSRDVPWHRRFEVCSIGIVTFAIYLAGLAATFALILVLVCNSFYTILKCPDFYIYLEIQKHLKFHISEFF